ncbi:MAG TPA: nucleotidyltransferase domain-containing protein [Acidobacteriota bacterium]|nr:nucleotidyltransferase domain-containing protein [Acidobacteriota bacterium]
MRSLKAHLCEAERQAVKAQIAAILEKNEEVVFGVTFGSFQEGLAFEDIDVAVYLAGAFEELERFEKETKLALELEKSLRLPVDVRILNGASLGFQYAVSSGELVFSRHPTAFPDFREIVWQRYLDHKYFYEQSLRDLLKS